MFESKEEARYVVDAELAQSRANPYETPPRDDDPVPFHVCPNCTENVENHPHNGCVLNALIEVVRERGDTPEDMLRELHADCDVDFLWHQLGPIVDQLEAGDFSLTS